MGGMLKWFQKVATNPTEQLLQELKCDYWWHRDGNYYFVEGDIYLFDKRLTELPDLSRVHLKGSFYCYKNNLTSLKGSPARVYGAFDCSSNQLTTLDGAPATVSSTFNCSSNHLTTLDGAPATVGSFNCSSNQLTTLKGGPTSVDEVYWCNNNLLTTLEGAPAAVDIVFVCSDNLLTALEGAPSRCKIKSDFGTFKSWNDVPENLRIAPEKKQKQQQEALQTLVRDATVAQAPVAVPRRIRLHKNKPMQQS